MKKQKLVLAIAAVVLILLITAFILGKRKAAAKKEKLRQIDAILESGMGAKGNDVDMLLLEVKPDAKYAAKTDAEALIKAQGTFKDDETKILSILAGKTRSQYAALNSVMKQFYGKSLKQYIDEVFKQYKDMGLSGTYPSYEKVFTMIKSSR